jgi:hypothetical protein
VRIAAFAFLLLVYLAMPFLDWSPGIGFRILPPAVMSGDEPHYLIILSTLLRDHTLEVGHAYDRVHKGGLDAGLHFPRNALDHHTIAVDLRTGEHELWPYLFDRWHQGKDGSFRRTAGGFPNRFIEVPAHPPAFPALVAIFVWPFRNRPLLLERYAIECNALFAALTLLAIGFAARAAGFTPRETAFTLLLAGVASPMLPYAKSFFSEPATGLFLALALWALLSKRPIWCGVFCFCAFAMKPGFGLPVVGWAALRWKQGKVREESLPMLVPFAMGCALLAIFNWWFARTPVVAGAGGFQPVHGLANFGKLFFSDEHGLLTFAPWAVFAIAAGVKWPELSWGAAPVWFLLATQDLDAGGFAYGPRYFVPFVPWLALAAVRWFRGAKLPGRAAFIALASLGVLFAVPGALRYGQLFARPPLAALDRR